MAHELNTLLGEKPFHAMIVSHGIRQFFYPPTEQANQDFQIQLWKSSLACAHFARVLATLTSYHSLEEAYLCGSPGMIDISMFTQ